MTRVFRAIAEDRKMMSFAARLKTFTVAASLVLAAAPASAELIYGVNSSAYNFIPSLLSFDSASPQDVTNIGNLSGVVEGQTIRAIDFRPSNGQLYAVSSETVFGAVAQLYTVDLASGALTKVGNGFAIDNSQLIFFPPAVALDFDPVADVLRVVTDGGGNYRVDADTGALIAQDTTVVNGGLIDSTAYSNNRPGATSTTLYAYDVINNRIETIGGIDGTPSPNGGSVMNVGYSGVESNLSFRYGFDISGATGTAYVSLNDATDDTVFLSEFYTLNLATGALTYVGRSAVELQDFSVAIAPAGVPEPGTVVLLAMGLLAIGAATRSRHRH